MTSRTMVRCAVLVLAALLAIDASLCCDEMIFTQPSVTTFLTSPNDVCGDDGGQLDCHACICSGLALVEMTHLYAQPLQSTALAMMATGHPVCKTAPVDIPPDKRG